MSRNKLEKDQKKKQEREDFEGWPSTKRELNKRKKFNIEKQKYKIQSRKATSTNILHTYFLPDLLCFKWFNLINIKFHT